MKKNINSVCWVRLHWPATQSQKPFPNRRKPVKAFANPAGLLVCIAAIHLRAELRNIYTYDL